MLDMDKIVALRNAQIKRMRKAQMTIAIIDATITTDPRYLDQLDQYEGDVATAFPNPLQAVEDHPEAMFN